MALWTITEQNNIKPIESHRASSIFSKLADETQEVELKELLGHEFYNHLVNNVGDYSDLIDGTTYEYEGVTYEVKGLKYVLSYLLYERYINESSMFDTYSGFTNKNMDDSQRISSGKMKNLQNQTRRTAMSYWDDCKLMMNRNSSDYTYWNCNKRNFKIRTL